MTEQKTIAAYKGFDKNWKCRDFQYAVGKTYAHAGWCSNPDDIIHMGAPNSGAVVSATADSATKEAK